MLVPLALLSLGAIFAWSVLNQPLMRVNGVVAPSAADWALSDIQVTFSLVMGGFMWGAVFGGFHERWGPRACCLIGAGAVVMAPATAVTVASTSPPVQSICHANLPAASVASRSAPGL